ncbi:MAG: Crp/Fnr family transcriptional regulator [Bacteroidales bacterium]|jgi:CRP-like cAMP-binding protein|nr:Crp/Fnr family transcriptional regulator [Bacteroidales bacterium]
MKYESLFSNPLFAVIPKELQEDFLQNTNVVIKKYSKGETIMRQGDGISALYFLYEGKVKTEMITDSGDVLNIEIINAPTPLALAFLFADDNKFPVDVIALEDCEIILFPKKSIVKLLTESESFMRTYMSFSSSKTQFLSERIKFLSIKTIKGKLAYYILSKNAGGEFDLELNQTELAEFFGVTRPSLARSLSEIIDEGIITLDKKKGIILNEKKLKELLK